MKELVHIQRNRTQYLSNDMEEQPKDMIEAIFNSLLFERNILFNPDIKKFYEQQKRQTIMQSSTSRIIKQDLKQYGGRMKILSHNSARPSPLCATGRSTFINSTKAELTLQPVQYSRYRQGSMEEWMEDLRISLRVPIKPRKINQIPRKKEAVELREGINDCSGQTRVSEHSHSHQSITQRTNTVCWSH